MLEYWLEQKPQQTSPSCYTGLTVCSFILTDYNPRTHSRKIQTHYIKFRFPLYIPQRKTYGYFVYRESLKILFKKTSLVSKIWDTSDRNKEGSSQGMCMGMCVHVCEDGLLNLHSIVTVHTASTEFWALILYKLHLKMTGT